ncbi:hypothetical protein H4Q26_002060 [Puccinia striiformis f. sp. tritici PST-130]|nr:hypothetical protein H4Q26_002060 [Puccinia striiformis f. sp. tritici PST-130]
MNLFNHDSHPREKGTNQNHIYQRYLQTSHDIFKVICQGHINLRHMFVYLQRHYPVLGYLCHLSSACGQILSTSDPSNITLSLLYSRKCNVLLPHSIQGPVDFPLDQDIDKLGKLNNPRKKTPLEDVPQSTPNRQDPIDPLDVPSSRSSSRSSLPAKTERGRSRRRRNPDLTQNGDSDSEEDPPYEQAPEDPQGLISTLIKALNARPTSDHTTSKFKTPGMKAPDRFDGESPSKLRPSSSLPILFSNDPAPLPMIDKGYLPCSVTLTKFATQNTSSNLQMKESGKASAYIAQFRTPISNQLERSAFTFHFRKGLPPRITDQLAISGLRLTLTQLIDRTIERQLLPRQESLENQNSRSKTILQNLSNKSQENRNNIFRIFKYPASSSSKPNQDDSKEISSVLSKEGFLKDERAREKKAYSFIGLCKFSSEPSYWVSQKAKWTFKFSTFPSFEWELVVLDAPGMDDTILGHDFLVHWNPDVNWKEGVINLRTNTPSLLTFLLSKLN